MLKRTRIIAPAVFVAMLAALLTFAFASTAFAAPGVTYAKFSNPVAYELKSLLSTRFTCDVDTPGTWGRLDILGANGVVKTVYNGPLTQGANWFPLWNGLDNAGKRLPSASYDWRLTVTKGAESTVVRGKITVSKIQFVVKGRSDGQVITFQDRYMIPGSANIYWQATNRTSSSSSLHVELRAPSTVASPVGRVVGYGDIEFDPSETVKGTWYLRKEPGNDTLLYDRGVHRFAIRSLNVVDYYMTVIQ